MKIGACELIPDGIQGNGQEPCLWQSESEIGEGSREMP